MGTPADAGEGRPMKDFADLLHAALKDIDALIDAGPLTPERALVVTLAAQSIAGIAARLKIPGIDVDAGDTAIRKIQESA